MLIQQLLALKPAQVSEEIVVEAEYDSSIDFEDDVNKVSKHFDELKTLLGSAEMMDWMKATDSNFGNKGFATSLAKIVSTIKQADKDFDDLYGQLVDISEE